MITKHGCNSLQLCGRLEELGRGSLDFYRGSVALAADDLDTAEARLQAVVQEHDQPHARALFNLGKLYWLKRAASPENGLQSHQYLLKVSAGHSLTSTC